MDCLQYIGDLSLDSKVRKPSSSRWSRHGNTSVTIAVSPASRSHLSFGQEKTGGDRISPLAFSIRSGTYGVRVDYGWSSEGCASTLTLNLATVVPLPCPPLTLPSEINRIVGQIPGIIDWIDHATTELSVRAGRVDIRR